MHDITGLVPSVIKDSSNHQRQARTTVSQTDRDTSTHIYLRRPTVLLALLIYIYIFRRPPPPPPLRPFYTFYDRQSAFIHCIDRLSSRLRNHVRSRHCHLLSIHDSSDETKTTSPKWPTLPITTPSVRQPSSMAPRGLVVIQVCRFSCFCCHFGGESVQKL